MKKLNYLSKSEMRKVSGGLLSTGKCTASCGDKQDAVCEGSNCTALDNVGCSAGDTVISCENQPKKTID